MQEQEVARKLELCVGSFKKVLYEPDDIFLALCTGFCHHQFPLLFGIF